jgi:hypothetical protein
MAGDRQIVRQRRERQLAPPMNRQIAYPLYAVRDAIFPCAWQSILTTLTDESFIYVR